MDIRKVNATFSVSDQIGSEDIALISSMGYRAIICNRPDGESEYQPLFEALQTLAEQNDMQMVHLPIGPSGPTEADVAAFAQAFAALPKPVLAYCQSGNRSMAVWKAGVDTQVP